jgi:hypothetical protein
VFLIVNPALLWLFRRFNLNLKKLAFWIMLTTGIAWLISLAFFFLTPEQHLNPIWDTGEKLLPSLAFSLDGISSSYFLAVTSLIFFGILVEEFSPQTNAWITAMGGVCVIGTLVDSAYALALVWTVVESLSLYGYLKNQGEMEGNQKYILAILIRLTAPLLIIYISVMNSETGIAPYLTELPSSAAPYLLAAGIVGFGGWALIPRGSEEEQPVFQPGKYASWIPAVLGLVMITRAAQIFSGNGSTPGLFITAAVLFFLLSVASALFSQPERSWRIGILALLIGSFSFAAPKAVLAWGVIFILPGIVLFRNFKSNKTATLALILGGIGILPVPFLPAWAGMISFDGIPGLFYAGLAGIFLGKTLNLGIQTWQGKEGESEPISPLVITGYLVVLASQLAISIQSGLIGVSLAILAVPISAWVALTLFIPAALFWSRIPELEIPWWQKSILKIRNIIDDLSASLTRITDGSVYLFTRLFEGDGGLIWTILFSFLIITLVSLRGG